MIIIRIQAELDIDLRKVCCIELALQVFFASTKLSL